jgi:CBS domain-containing membrane protein
MPHPIKHRQILIPAAAALFAIMVVGTVSDSLLQGSGLTHFMIASMGASSLLLFVIPTSPISQPWALFGGQMVSGVIGTTLALTVADISIAAALAVSLSLIAMMYMRCLHPPGGATALIPILLGPEIHEIGFVFVVTPIFINTVILLGISLFVNRVILNRHYASQSLPEPEETQRQTNAIIQSSPFSKEDLEYAFQKMDTFVDVNAEDLFRIYSHATAHAEERGAHVPCLRKVCSRKVTRKSQIVRDAAAN